MRDLRHSVRISGGVEKSRIDKSLILWWACLDSNQEPDRYERPALTIELQAPPQAAMQDDRQRCRHRLQGCLRSGHAAVSPPKPRKLHPLAPFLGLVGNELAEFRRRHRFRDAADFAEPR